MRMSASPGPKTSAVRFSEHHGSNAGTFSEDPHNSIYPSAKSIHRVKTIPHNKTPYAHSSEFVALKEEVQAFNEGGCVMSEADVSQREPMDVSQPQRSTLLDHNPEKPFSSEQAAINGRVSSRKYIAAPQPERSDDAAGLVHVGTGIAGGPEKVPQKSYSVMVHQQPPRSDYSRQVVGRYEASVNSPSGRRAAADLYHY
ncbi:unnamed protein product [Amoebophrya sp. A25]|nr:unnamed protein product [Amoebophrya sp. A25]|eukprot:GSA25T00027939001.1